MRMEQRKVQLAGGSTYTISLPKEWASDHNIEAGERLALRPSGNGTLIVDPSSDPDEADAYRVDVTDYEPQWTARTVWALYMLGYDEFTLSTSKEFPDEQRTAVLDAATALRGLETIQESSTEIRLGVLVDMERLPVDRVVTGMHESVQSMHRHATIAFTENDEQTATLTLDRRSEAAAKRALVSRYIRHAIREHPQPSVADRSQYTVWVSYRVAQLLEDIAATAVTIATLVGDDVAIPDDWNEEFDELARQSRRAVERAVESALPPEATAAETAYEAATTCDDLNGILTSFDEQVSGTTVDRATAALDRTVSAATDIALIGIETAHWTSPS